MTFSLSWREYTRNRALSVRVGRAALFCKYIPNHAEGYAQRLGQRLLLSYGWPVARLRLSVPLPGGELHVFDSLRYANRSNCGLLVDFFSTGRSATGCAPGQLISEICDFYLENFKHAQLVPGTEIVGKLYRDRVMPGGRLEAYYGATGSSSISLDGVHSIRLRDLRAWTIIVNGKALNLDWAHLLSEARQAFVDDCHWSCITQGDPTDVNIADPFTLLDYDTAGMNAVAGELATLLWDIATHGGWLAPTYNAKAYIDHPAALETIEENTPTVRVKVDWSSLSIQIDYQSRLMPQRREALREFSARLLEWSTEILWNGSGAMPMRPFLFLRMVGVFNLCQMRPLEAAFIVARLAELADETFEPRTFFDLE